MSADPTPGRPECAVLTGAGLGAIAVVRVWGEGALALVDRLFRPNAGRGLGVTPERRLRVGRLGAGTGDEVVVYRLAGPPESVEIQCHGGLAATELVLEALEAGGAIRVRADRWVTRTAGSPLRAQAQLDLVRAGTLRAATILLDQARGALDSELDRLAALPDASAELAAGLATLRAWAAVGTRLVGGWRIALAGRPNVGKSSLLNALAGFERAIVTPVPGTTRDVVRLATAFDGWPVELSDTAGLRTTDDPLERAGIAVAQHAHERADRIVLVLDGSAPLAAEDHALRALHPAAIVVASKADLPAAWDPGSLGALAVSAVRGDGLPALIARLGPALVPEAPPPGVAVPFRADHERALALAEAALASDGPAAARRVLRGLRERGEVPPVEA